MLMKVDRLQTTGVTIESALWRQLGFMVHAGTFKVKLILFLELVRSGAVVGRELPVDCVSTVPGGRTARGHFIFQL